MGMKQSFIEVFEVSDSQLLFAGCHVFSSKDRHVLLGDNGNMILLNQKLFQKILDRKLDDDLWFKLLQRGLAIHKERGNFASPENVPVKPTYFMIDLGSRCNMQCRYCLRDSEDALDADVVNYETMTAICNYIADYCEKNHIRQIYMQPWGGEPLLEKEKIFFIQEEMKRNGIDAGITIETNGLLLTDCVIKELYDRGISYGISIDGFSDIHDRQRMLANGMGTHKKVEQAVKDTQRYYGKDTSVLATVTKQSVCHIEKIIDYFALELKLNKIKINFVHKSIFQQEDGFCVTAEDIKTGTERMFEKIVSLNEEGIDIMEYNIWAKMINILTNRRLDACISRGCTGGRSMVTFDSKGNIFPCDVTDFPEEMMGSITDGQDLKELIEKAVKEKSYFAIKESDECKKCPWKHFCNGGCTVHVKCAGGGPGSVDWMECTVNKIIYPKIMELILDKPELVNRMTGYKIL